MAGKTDPFLVDDENPEWTDQDFARARPAREALAPELFAELTKAAASAEPTPAKVAVTLRIDRRIVEAFKADGPGWQDRINDALGAALAARRSGERA
jgi:uncharacterized protein (DUF4415 family)